MLAICVDDEPLLLAELVRAVSSSPDISAVEQFRHASAVLEWIESNKPDIAFLDIQLRGSTGLELADKILAKHPETKIIFCTGYREYAFDAFRIHASGYIEKPVTAEAIQKEIDHVKSAAASSSKLLKVNCFGTFEVLKDGVPLHFKRKRSKEVFAYLVDRRGASVTAKEICAAMWEDDDTDKNVMYLYKLIAELRDALADAGVEEVFIRQNYDYSVAADKLDCDYYKYLAGDPAASKSFCGEYMVQYPWAEETAALLYDELN